MRVTRVITAFCRHRVLGQTLRGGHVSPASNAGSSNVAIIVEHKCMWVSGDFRKVNERYWPVNISCTAPISGRIRETEKVAHVRSLTPDICRCSLALFASTDRSWRRPQGSRD